MTNLTGAVEPTLGDHARDEALARVLKRLPADDEWRIQAVRMIADLAAGGCVFETYDLTLQGLPDPVSPSQWGAVVNLCARNGLIEIAGFGSSSRPTVNSSKVLHWRGAL